MAAASTPARSPVRATAISVSPSCTRGRGRRAGRSVCRPRASTERAWLSPCRPAPTGARVTTVLDDALEPELEDGGCPHVAVLLRTREELPSVQASFYALGAK